MTSVQLLNCVLLFKVKGQVQCFSMLIVTNKYFLLNTEKKLAQNPSRRFRENAKKHTLIPKMT